MSADPHLPARLAALERAFGLPRRVPLLQCDACGYAIAELSARRRRSIVCPHCGHRSLHHIGLVDWPPR